MIDRIEVRNFQSLLVAELNLGRLTVLVGPSSTGKSAVLRAARVVARNTSGTQAVSTGSKAFTVKLVAAQWAAWVERGNALSTYTLSTAKGEEAYPKSGTSVPEDVAATTRLSDLNFAFQFDPPYLLSDPPSHAAKVLGALTNVTVLAEAAREAHRWGLTATHDARRYIADVEQCREHLQDYQDLPDKVQAAERLRRELTEVRVVAVRLEAVSRLCEDLGVLDLALRETSGRLARLNPYLTLPDLRVEAERLAVITRLLSERTRLSADCLVATDEAEACGEQAFELAAEHDRLLREAGQCPTCGAVVNGSTPFSPHHKLRSSVN